MTTNDPRTCEGDPSRSTALGMTEAATCVLPVGRRLYRRTAACTRSTASNKARSNSHSSYGAVAIDEHVIALTKGTSAIRSRAIPTTIPTGTHRVAIRVHLR